MDKAAKRASLRAAIIQASKEAFAARENTIIVAPISPTPLPIVQAVLDKVSVNADDVVLDLGCGDGRWLVAAAEAYGCRCVGYELEDERIAKCGEAIAAAGVGALVRC
uniref:Methyltransferase domain-containing protein n=1 Tax=Phaeomonas parva TaxID=124430 RepID=A0A7S1XND7_9STRA|mmetsp:Transcript_19878/g.60222  ORF Transcript_19878/g.60222 Transcript_19878/m.60222 type:complete len:108 (+) Transcript_19878:159-482(+)